jgi:hypothetical protein
MANRHKSVISVSLFIIFLVIAFNVSNSGVNLSYSTLANGTQLSERQVQSENIQTLANVSTEDRITSLNYDTYTNPGYGFQILNPVNWKVLESTDDESGEVVKFVPPGEENSFVYKVNFGVYYYEANSNDDVSNILEDTIDLYSSDDEGYDNFELMDQSTTTVKLSGYPAYSLLATYEYEGKQSKIMEVGMKIGDVQYNLLYDAEIDKFDQYLPQIKEMIKSFQLI